MFDKIERLTTFAWCIEHLTALTDPERGLLREIFNQIGKGSLAAWGAANRHRQDEVRQLFQKCQRLINA